MTGAKKQRNRARALRAAELLLAAATLLAAALLIAQCIAIYRAGMSDSNLTQAGVRISDMYSRELVTARLLDISWVFLIWAGALMLTLVMRALAGHSKPKPMRIAPEARLASVLSRVAITDAMRAEERKRRIAASLFALACCACAVPIIVYFLTASHFVGRDLEAVMGAMLFSAAPFVAALFLALLLFQGFEQKSLSRELEAAKTAPRKASEPQGAQRSTFLAYGRVALLAAAALLILKGILNGGMYDVLVKAINICTECIGLG